MLNGQRLAAHWTKLSGKEHGWQAVCPRERKREKKKEVVPGAVVWSLVTIKKCK